MCVLFVCIFSLPGKVEVGKYHGPGKAVGCNRLSLMVRSARINGV